MHLRDVAVENRTEIKGRSKRVDYAFRIGGLDRWICEAKKPFDGLSRHYFQVQNYVFHMRIWLGVLSDFDRFVVFVVGGRPSKSRPFTPIPDWDLHHSQYPANSQRIWDLFSREAVENGSLEKFIQKAIGKVRTKAVQGWLIKPDRTKAVDGRFLSFLEEQRKGFARDLVRRNPDVRWTGPYLADCLQTVFNRLLFQRVSEDRNIDVGTPLYKTLLSWEGRGRIRGQLWPSLVANFKHLSLTFNGGIYGAPRRSSDTVDAMSISDALLSDFIEQIAGDDADWLFGTMPVWIFGLVYGHSLPGTGRERDDSA